MGSGDENDPACRPLAFSLVHTDREPGTGQVNRDEVEGVEEFLVDSCPRSGNICSLSNTILSVEPNDPLETTT